MYSSLYPSPRVSLIFTLAAQLSLINKEAAFANRTWLVPLVEQPARWTFERAALEPSRGRSPSIIVPWIWLHAKSTRCALKWRAIVRKGNGSSWFRPSPNDLNRLPLSKTLLTIHVVKFSSKYILSLYLSLFKSNLNLIQFVKLENVLFLHDVHSLLLNNSMIIFTYS